MPQRSTKGTNAVLAHLVRFVLSCVFVAVSWASVDAASLYGKVIEVNSGDVITIQNLNRPVRVKLLGVDAPELDQAFGDVAKKHLSDLVFDKPVLVHYSGIAADKSLTGRVLLNDADVGAQMIRDGAAWFDPNNMDRLDENDREVYQQSELAARNERRGLWQQPNPTAPWEFVKAEALKKNPVASLKTNYSSTLVRRSGSGSELTNLTLIMTPALRSGDAGPTEATLLKREEFDGVDLPDDLPFRVSVPRGGKRIVKSISFGTEIVKTNDYAVAEGQTQFVVTWFTAPTYGEDDKTALNQMVFEGALRGAGGAFNGGGPQARCTPQSEREIAANGYWGQELDLSACPIPALMRAFTKVTGGRREIYVALVNFKVDEPNATQFINSFTIRGNKPSKAK
jgi:endonuclease YncB( thermonuclease family)